MSAYEEAAEAESPAASAFEGATGGTVAWDRLAAEAVILAGTIAETLANGILPEGLWLNEPRLAVVVGHLREAIEAMGAIDEGGR